MQFTITLQRPAVAAVLSAAVGTAQAAPTTYQVQLGNGTDNLFGSITTDGTLGALAASNILTGAASPFFAISGNGVGCNLIGCGLTARATRLEFDNVTAHQVQFSSVQTGGSQLYLRSAFNSWLDQHASPSAFRFMGFPQSANVTLGTVPEPASLALVCAGLAAAAFEARRKA